MGYVTSGGVKGDRRAVYVDPHPDPQLEASACDYGHAHTPQPRGYLERHEWAYAKARTHECVRCECGLWAIWRRR